MRLVLTNSDGGRFRSIPGGGATKQPIGERQVAVAVQVLLGLPERGREALMRYYQGRESAEEIQAALGLSAAEFGDLKIKAKARWTALCSAGIRKSAVSEAAAIPAKRQA